MSVVAIVAAAGEAQVDAARAALAVETPAPASVGATHGARGPEVVAVYDDELDVETEHRLRAVMLRAVADAGRAVPEVADDGLRSLLLAILAQAQDNADAIASLADRLDELGA